jgi:hypothetical protein
MTKKGVIQWENGWGGSGGLKRIFSGVRVLGIRKKIKKKIRFHPPHPFSHCITIFHMEPSEIHFSMNLNFFLIKFLKKATDSKIVLPLPRKSTETQ